MQRSIARPSVASLPIEAQFGGQGLSTATGFIVERGDRHYLITNWHVAAGKRPDTGVVLSGGGAVPDEVIIMHNQAGALGSWIPKTELLYDGDGNPRWREHPTYGRQVDVVALELNELAGVDFYTHDPWSTGPAVAFGIAGPLSIIGFPFGITGGGALGVWVQGTVATEPDINFDDLPCFLIDSRTRPGQSGSPVIAYYAGGAVPMEDGGTAVLGSPVERFLGVYSGRISDQSDLGYVWKTEAVREIVDRGIQGQV